MCVAEEGRGPKKKGKNGNVGVGNSERRKRTYRGFIQYKK